MMRHLRTTSFSFALAMMRVAVLGAVACAVVRADSAIELLGGFDAARLAAVFEQGESKPHVAELAKLVFRVDKLDPSSLQSLADKPPADKPTTPSPLRLGDVLKLAGQVRDVQRVAVPTELAELLEFNQFYRVVIQPLSESTQDANGSTMSLYVKQIPSGLASGDHVATTAIVIGTHHDDDDDDSDAGQHTAIDESSAVFAVAAPRLRWTPSKSTRLGLKLLADEGVDIASVASLESRNRRPLQSADSDAFYPMLAAATDLASKDVPQPESIQPAALLQDPRKWIGDWIRFEAETVRITQVAVTEPLRRRQLGGDSYFQIDAIGDLGNVVVELERAEGSPVRFENRFPVSIVMTKLPEFLARKMQNDQGVSVGVQMVSTRVQVDGFFFRLWSYENERMNQAGQGEQIGPLVVASRMTSLEIQGSDPIGVSKIGYIAAGGVIIGLALVGWWTRSNRLSDSAAHASHNQRFDDDVSWLNETTTDETSTDDDPQSHSKPQP